MVGAKFINGELQIDWEDLELFLLDKPYWKKYKITTTQYPEGLSTYDYHPYGNTDASTAINVDGSLIDNDQVKETMDCLNEHRKNLLNINAKIWEISSST